MTRTAGKLGRLAPHPDRLGLILDQHIAPDAPPVPAVVDWMTGVDSWPMYGNDQWGDCVWAGAGHAIESITRYGSGKTVEVTDADVLKGYSDVTGFDPDAGGPGENPTDQGTVISDMLDYWRKVGIAGHKILAHGEIRDPKLVQPALNLFGCLVLGVDLPDSAQTQFGLGEPWTVVRGAQIEGGHCFVVPYEDKTEPTAITWAAKQLVTPPWWTKYVSEVHAVISPEWIEATGKCPSGLDEDGLGAQFTALTGQPSPFRRAGH